jgi:hypothetical protein
LSGQTPATQALAGLPSAETVKRMQVEAREVAIEQFRQSRLVHHQARAAAGEIPLSQAEIFTNLDVREFRIAVERAEPA